MSNNSIPQVKTICVVGLGYVGLPLAAVFGKTNYKVYGYDVNKHKVDELLKHHDINDELTAEQLKATKVEYTTDPKVALPNADVIIVAMPTPVDSANVPDITLLKLASATVGKYMKKGAIVVYESTVYPGCTEDDCAPVLEKESGMKSGKDFYLGYSPERINPGDKEHTVDKIIKVVAGQTPVITEVLSGVYGSVITAGIHKASSIKVAEAAKVIENTQRDLNIALMNELSIIFNKMGISTKEVLQAAGTKWNFHKYTPGLVGGHCIGVDPYYLTYAAKKLGYHSKVILAGREINDEMANVVVENTVRTLNKMGKHISDSKVLILGLTFKENVKDARNSKTKDMIRDFKEHGVQLIAHDPYLTNEELEEEEFGIHSTPLNKIGKVDAIVLTVPHKEFKAMSLKDLANMCTDKKLLVDIKGMHNKADAQAAGFTYYSLH